MFKFPLIEADASIGITSPLQKTNNNTKFNLLLYTIDASVNKLSLKLLYSTYILFTEISEISEELKRRA
jgi:hypothetical protein